MTPPPNDPTTGLAEPAGTGPVSPAPQDPGRATNGDTDQSRTGGPNGTTGTDQSRAVAPGGSANGDTGPVRPEAAGRPGYGAAIEELESILAELEGRDVDVDVLADRVARGAELVRVCRQHLRAARVEVDAVIEELLDETADGPSR